MKIMMLFCGDRQSSFGVLKAVFPLSRHVHQKFQHEKSNDRRESALRPQNFAAIVEKLVCDDSAAVRLHDFVLRYCSRPTSDIFKSGDFKTVVRKEK